MALMDDILQGVQVGLDPANLAGFRTPTDSGVSTVSGSGVAPKAMDPAEENRLRQQEYDAWKAQQAATQQQHQQQAQGFMANMGWKPQATMFGANPGPMPAAPNAGWAYTPGQGAAWQTPQHTIQAGPDLQSQNWSMKTQAPGTAFQGNRI